MTSVTSKAGVVKTEHNEKRFDAYYFVDATPAEILNDYYQVTGKPVRFLKMLSISDI